MEMLSKFIKYILTNPKFVPQESTYPLYCNIEVYIGGNLLF